MRSVCSSIQMMRTMKILMSKLMRFINMIMKIMWKLTKMWWWLWGWWWIWWFIWMWQWARCYTIDNCPHESNPGQEDKDKVIIFEMMIIFIFVNSIISIFVIMVTFIFVKIIRIIFIKIIDHIDHHCHDYHIIPPCDHFLCLQQHPCHHNDNHDNLDQHLGLKRRHLRQLPIHLKHASTRHW